MVQLTISDFVTRQKENSTFSHFDGAWEEVLLLGYENWYQRKPSKGREDVWEVPVDPSRFMSAVIPLEPGMKISTEFKVREKAPDPKEAPVLSQVVRGASKVPAKYCELIFYPMGKDSYQLVSMNASPTTRPTPPNPVSMARNQKGKFGGSPAKYPTELWAESVWFWARHAMFA